MAKRVSKGRGAERKRAQEALRRLAAVVMDSNDAITVHSLDGRITAWNRGAERMYGYGEAEALGMNILDIVPEGKRPEAEAFIERLGRGEAVESLETQRVTKDGRVLDVWLTVTALVDESGDPAALATTERDITERKRADEQIRALNADLEQRVIARTAELEAANEELKAFSRSVAHDLRSPLRSMDGFSQALLEDYADKLDEQGKDYLQRVRGAAQRMGHLLDDLLALSRVTRVEMRRGPVDLSALARTTAEEFRKQDPGRRAQFVIADGLVANGDPELLQVVLENLLGNAWKFTATHPEAKVEFGASPHQAGEPVYFVRDDGVGFDMAYADKLFGPFQRLHGTDEFPGSGIGLASVQRIIHRHGGRVWAEGAVEQGATFYFTL
jgi:PAS domain S-box-containing protein